MLKVNGKAPPLARYLRIEPVSLLRRQRCELLEVIANPP